MKKLLYLFFLSILVSGQVVCGQSDSEIVASERGFYDDLKNKRLEVLPEYFHHDFTGVFGLGVLDKKSEVAGFSQAVLESYAFKNIVVKFPQPDIGVIAYQADIIGSYKGKDISGSSYHVSAWIKQNEKWLMIVHSEAAAVKKPGRIGGIATVVYKVADITKGKTWYSRTFGTAPYFDDEFYVGFNIAGFELGLQPEEGKAKRSDFAVAYWTVCDLEKVYAEFVSAGAIPVEKPTDVGGGIRIASVKDPWGNVIGLIYDPNKN